LTATGDERRFVVADASPLIGLAAAGAFALLRELYGTVTITRIVLEEVRAGGRLPGVEELEAALADGWLRVAPAPPETWRYAELDAGEASTIALALESRGEPLVLMDDLRGRAVAESLGLPVADVPAVLLAAKAAGAIAQVRPHVDRLARRGFTLPQEAIRALLAAAGEA